MVFECVCLWDAAKLNSAYRESDTRSKWIEENKGLFSPLIPLVLPTVVTLIYLLFFSLSICPLTAPLEKHENWAHKHKHIQLWQKVTNNVWHFLSSLSLQAVIQMPHSLSNSDIQRTFIKLQPAANSLFEASIGIKLMPCDCEDKYAECFYLIINPRTQTLDDFPPIPTIEMLYNVTSQLHYKPKINDYKLDWKILLML